MNRIVQSFALLALAAGIAALPSAAQDKKKKNKEKANDGRVDNWEKPKNFSTGKVNAFWVWHDDGVWHLRTTGGGKGAHRFQGTVEVVGGKLVDLKGKTGEYKGKLADRYVFNKALTAIAFDFKTDESADGFNFAVDAKATGLKFTFALDGDEKPGHIFVGKDGDHPASAVFLAPAHPPESAEPKGKPKKK